MLAGVTDCRKSQKWGCKGRWALGFKPRRGSHRRRGPHGSEGKERGPRSSEGKREDHVVLECFFLPRGLGSRRDFTGKERGERTLAGEP